MSKIWIGCAAVAASLAALIVGPGQAAQKMAAAEVAPITATPEVKLVQAPASLPQATRQANSAEQPVRAVRVVYPSHYADQR